MALGAGLLVGATQCARRLQLKRCLFPEETLKLAIGVTHTGALIGFKYQLPRGTIVGTLFTARGATFLTLHVWDRI